MNPMKTMMVMGLFGGLALACLNTAAAHAEVLITPEEAKLPPAATIPMRGITRGPGIEQVSPQPDSGVASPLSFKIKFESRNKVEVDPRSVKLIYLRARSIDLTDRIRSHVTADGIEMDRAEVPPGVHALRLDIADKQGRTASAIIRLTVTAQ
jgi:hypothetical protein